MDHPATVNRQLLDAASMLAHEYADQNAGSVIRCFARAVRRSRRSGVGLTELPTASEQLARQMLDRRRLRATPVAAGRPQPCVS